MYIYFEKVGAATLFDCILQERITADATWQIVTGKLKVDSYYFTLTFRNK